MSDWEPKLSYIIQGVFFFSFFFSSPCLCVYRATSSFSWLRETSEWERGVKRGEGGGVCLFISIFIFTECSSRAVTESKRHLWDKLMRQFFPLCLIQLHCLIKGSGALLVLFVCLFIYLFFCCVCVCVCVCARMHVESTLPLSLSFSPISSSLHFLVRVCKSLCVCVCVRTDVCVY